MTETTLRVSHEMVLSDDLRYTRYNTNDVKNLIEVNTQEKAFVRYPASSLDSSSIVWNIPSISGGAVARQLEVEVPIQFSITFVGTSPDIPDVGTLNDAAAVVANNDVLCVLNNGTSPRPFMTEMNCLDQFPLSKLFGNREITINNSATVLQEDLSPAQIDMMVAGGDLRKMRNAGLEPFADANSHFNTLANTWGGCMPALIYDRAGAQDRSVSQNWGLLFVAFANATTAARLGAVYTNFASPWSRSASDVCDTWAARRNRARNIVKSEMTVSAGTLGTCPGCGENQVVVLPGNATGGNQASYPGTAITYTFTITVREQLWSQYFDNEYTYNKFQWNKLMPLSSLNLKFNFNTTYLNEAILKIGDNIADILAQGGGQYSISTPTIPTQSSCFLYLKQCKIPLALLPRESYKITYYAQDKPQTRKRLGADFATKTITGSMQYANLAQIPEYLIISLPIDKTVYRARVVGGLATSSPYQLPSTFNLPITNLVLTFNQDTGLATHNLDMYTLQQYTLENLQNNEDLRDLIVGKGVCGVDAVSAVVNVINTGSTTGNAPNVGGIKERAIRELSKKYGYGLSQGVNYNGISNSSFYILKLGSQIRLPEGYSPGMIVNYNLEVTATCNLASTSLKRAYADCRSDVQKLLALGEDAFNALVADLEVIHFNKRILTISGDALQNLYVHNVQITSPEVLELYNSFMASFNKLSKDEVFDSRMMIGGGLFSRLRDKASSALAWLKPRVESALKTGREVVDVAKNVLGQDSSLRKYADMVDSGLSSIGYGNPHSVGGMNAHEVMAEGRRKPNGKTSKKAATEWANYIASMRQ